MEEINKSLEEEQSTGTLVCFLNVDGIGLCYLTALYYIL